MSVFNREKDKKDFACFLSEEANRIYKSLDQKCSGMFKSIDAYEREKGIFISNSRKIPLGSESFIFVLRKWNSFTPSLPGSTDGGPKISQHSVGGGYFLYLQSDSGDVLKPGYGLVIDPGYNFIHNFGLSGFSLDDIDGVFITHAHNDHTNDFESLLSILFQRNGRHLNNRSSKTVDIFMNLGAFKKFSNYLDLASKKKSNYIGVVNVLTPGDTISIPNRDDISCKIIALFTKHHEIITADYSIGIFISASDRNIVITGDTGWDVDTADKNNKLLKENGVVDGEGIKTDLLICHIGTTKATEFEDASSGNIFDRFYDKHLGVLGTISSIYQYKPEMCIVSEFGEELVGLRQSLVEEISIAAKKITADCICLTGDVGLGVFLDTRTTVDYGRKTLIDWGELLFEDVEESNGQKSIKYFSDGVDPRDIVISGGIDIFRNIYKEKIFSKTALAGKDKHALLREVSAFRFDVDDPDEIEYINDIFLALSCELLNPVELLPLLKSECHVWSIIHFLDAYDYDTEFLTKFAQVVDSFGFGMAEKTLLENILLGEATGNIDQCIRHYLAAVELTDETSKQMKLKEAETILDSLGKISIQTVWGKLKPEQHVGLFLEDNSVITCDFISESASFAAECIKEYSGVISSHKSTVEALKAKFFGPDERCWKGMGPIGAADIESAADIVAAELQDQFHAEIEPLKAEEERIGTFDVKLAELASELSKELDAIGNGITVKGEGIFDVIHGLYVLHLLRSRNMIEEKMLSNYHNKYKIIIN